jgi:hypothetical protein
MLKCIRDVTDFANWSRNKDGWGALETHHDPSRCAGIKMESKKIKVIHLSSSNLTGIEYDLPDLFLILSQTSVVPCDSASIF